MLRFILCLGVCLFPAFSQEMAQSSDDYEKWIEELGSETVSHREKAVTHILELGEHMLPYLEKAVNSDDPEIALRSRELILKIQAGSTQADSPFYVFSRLYQTADPSQKEGLFKEFLLRPDLPFNDFRAGVDMLMNDSSMNSSDLKREMNEFLIQKLEEKTVQMLNEGNKKQALHLWAGKEQDAYFRHRYTSLLYNSGLEFQPGLFSGQKSRLIEIERDLLSGQGDIHPEREILKDSDLFQKWSASHFDFEKRWKTMLPEWSTWSICHLNMLPLLNSKAKWEGNTSVRKGIKERVIREFESDTRRTNRFEIPNDVLMALNVLLLIAEPESIFEQFSRMIDSELLQNKYGAGIVTLGRSRLFNPCSIGVEDNSPESIIKFARELTSLAPEKVELRGDNNLQNTFNKIREQGLVLQKLVVLAHYMNSRGEKEPIIPILIDYMEKMAQNNLFRYPLFVFRNLIVPDDMGLAYQYYKECVERKLIVNEQKTFFETILIGGHDALLPNGLTEVSIIKDFLLEQNKEARDEEIVWKGMVLLGRVDGHEQEFETLFHDVLEFIKKNQGNAGELAKVLLKNYSGEWSKRKNFKAILDTVPEALFPDYGRSFLSFAEFITEVRLYGSEGTKNNYEQSLEKELSRYPLFFPGKDFGRGTKFVLAPQDHFILSPNNITQNAEALASFYRSNGKSEEAVHISRIGRLYAAEEGFARSMSIPLMDPFHYSCEEVMHEVTPFFVTGPGHPKLDLWDPFYCNAGIMMASRALLAGKGRETFYLVESVLGTIALSNEPHYFFFPYYIFLLRSCSDLGKGKWEWDQGKKEQAIKTLLEGFEQARHELSFEYLYWIYEYIPELRNVIQEWHEEEWAESQEKLAIWPNDEDLICNMINNSLMFGTHKEETKKLIRILPAEDQEEYKQLSKLWNLLHAGKNDRAAQFIIDYTSTQTPRNQAWTEMYYFLLHKRDPLPVVENVRDVSISD